MNDFELQPNPGIERVNSALTEAARNAVNVICYQIMKSTFELIQEKLENDAASLDKMIGEPVFQDSIPGGMTHTFVSEDINTAPSFNGKPQTTISIELEKRTYFGTPQEDEGDRLRIALEVDEDYDYPNPFNQTRSADRMYVVYKKNKSSVPKSSHGDNIAEEHGESSERFIIEQYSGNYRILRYTSQYDSAEQFIEDDESGDALIRSFEEPVSDDIEIASKIFRALRNFRIIPVASYELNEKNEWVPVEKQ